MIKICENIVECNKKFYLPEDKIATGDNCFTSLANISNHCVFRKAAKASQNAELFKCFLEDVIVDLNWV